MPDYLISAMLIVGWTSLIWAPVIIGVTVGRPRYRWPAAAGVAATMLVVFAGLYAALRPGSDCEGLREFERILCWERDAMGAAFLGDAIVYMTLAVLLASLIFLLGLAYQP